MAFLLSWNSTAFAISGHFSTVLSSNTTGLSDSNFTGPPDDVFVGLGGAIVTYDFSTLTTVNDGPGQDFNVYEVDFGGQEFGSIDVFVSANGTTFVLVDSTVGAKVELDNDNTHSNPSFARSYDLVGQRYELSVSSQPRRRLA